MKGPGHTYMSSNNTATVGKRQPRKPQDRKPKKTDQFEGAFSFTHNGETYTLRPTEEVVTPGFLRKNRKLDQVDIFFTMLEGLADEATLDVVDNMSRTEFNDLMEDFYAHLEASLPESSAS